MKNGSLDPLQASTITDRNVLCRPHIRSAAAVRPAASRGCRRPRARQGRQSQREAFARTARLSRTLIPSYRRRHLPARLSLGGKRHAVVERKVCAGTRARRTSASGAGRSFRSGQLNDPCSTRYQLISGARNRVTAHPDKDPLVKLRPIVLPELKTRSGRLA